MINTQTTRYIGVHVQREADHYWIMDDNGNEQYIGQRPPTDVEVDAYVHAVTNGMFGSKS